MIKISLAARDAPIGYGRGRGEESEAGVRGESANGKFASLRCAGPGALIPQPLLKPAGISGGHHDAPREFAAGAECDGRALMSRGRRCPQ